VASGAPRLLASGPAAGAHRWAWLFVQGLIVGLLFTLILVFRSRISMDFIDFLF